MRPSPGCACSDEERPRLLPLLQRRYRRERIDPVERVVADPLVSQLALEPKEGEP
jgi:hypothetical protein